MLGAPMLVQLYHNFINSRKCLVTFSRVPGLSRKVLSRWLPISHKHLRPTLVSPVALSLHISPNNQLTTQPPLFSLSPPTWKIYVPITQSCPTTHAFFQPKNKTLLVGLNLCVVSVFVYLVLSVYLLAFCFTSCKCRFLNASSKGETSFLFLCDFLNL